MIHTITLIILGALIIANLIVLINVSNNPMYNAMDKYNPTDEYVSSDDYVILQLRSLRTVVENIDERLHSLEDKFAYHIQSTDELKPKA